MKTAHLIDSISTSTNTKTSTRNTSFRNTNAKLVTFCKASSDQLRLDILKALSRDSFGVLELAQIFDCKQSLISHHLKILSNAGLVLKRREGNSIFYRRSPSLNNELFSDLKRELYRVIEQQTLTAEVCRKLSMLYKERAAKSQSYFQQNANNFRQHQEQVAAYALYAPNAKELIASSFAVDEIKTKTVLEIGPGEGEFLAELSSLFKSVIALDNSVEMLNKARKFVSRQNMTNIDFIEGDTKALACDKLKVDCVVLNMVLHHTSSPQAVLYDIAKVLEKDGQLFITELCSHDQSWVKDACGDLWLGFDADDISSWASKADFREGESVYLAQRNGFRVQIRQFLKC